MALTINQTDLYRFERLVSKLSKPSEPPVVSFIPCPDGSVKLAAFHRDAILTMPVVAPRCTTHVCEYRQFGKKS